MKIRHGNASAEREGEANSLRLAVEPRMGGVSQEPLVWQLTIRGQWAAGLVALAELAERVEGSVPVGELLRQAWAWAPASAPLAASAAWDYPGKKAHAVY